MTKLAEADAMLAAGRSVAQIVQTLDASEAMFARWQSQCGGMRAKESRRLQELEIEDQHLMRWVSDRRLDIAIPNEADESRYNLEPLGQEECREARSGMTSKGGPPRLSRARQTPVDAEHRVPSARSADEQVPWRMH